MHKVQTAVSTLSLLLFSLPACRIAFAQTTAPADDYVLVWSDDFSHDGPLNPADWSFERGFVRNQELQWYQPANAACSHGQLVIEARREQLPNPRFIPDSKQWQTARRTADYTSASVTTRNHHAWLYGRFEIRARIDASTGSWPAFWTLGTSGHWPACGEVDIMEFYRNTLLANIGWAKTPHDILWNSIKKPLPSLNDPQWSAKFHTWRMDWNEKEIALYVDSQLINRQDLAITLNQDNPADNPFHRPMYLILNQAIGGQGGDPSKTTFPLRFEIDYLRVYQRPSQMPPAPSAK